MCLQEIKDEIIDAGKESVLENMVSLYLHELSEKEEIRWLRSLYAAILCIRFFVEHIYEAFLPGSRAVTDPVPVARKPCFFWCMRSRMRCQSIVLAGLEVKIKNG